MVEVLSPSSARSGRTAVPPELSISARDASMSLYVIIQRVLQYGSMFVFQRGDRPGAHDVGVSAPTFAHVISRAVQEPGLWGRCFEGSFTQNR